MVLSLVLSLYILLLTLRNRCQKDEVLKEAGGQVIKNPKKLKLKHSCFESTVHILSLFFLNFPAWKVLCIY